MHVCLSDAVLLRFTEGQASPSDHEKIRAAAADCDACAALAAALSPGAPRDVTRAPGQVAADATHAPRARPLLGGRYALGRILGRGGMGVVHEAFDRVLDVRIAVKMLDPQHRYGGLRDEVAIARRITHPNVCRVHDVGQDGESLFLTMELVEGESLAQRLARRDRAPLSTDEARSVLSDIARGVDAAHREGVVHRDLKPQNVMLGARGAKVMDFGLAENVETAGSGVLAGTPAYMSPEQKAGHRATARSDLWALGKIIEEVSAAVSTPASLAPLRSFALRCLRELPSERPESARELEALLEGGTKSPASRWPLPPEPNAWVGSEELVARLDAALDRARPTTLRGLGGMGKSRLALHIAHGVARAGGRAVFVDAVGAEGPEELALRISVALRVPVLDHRPAALADVLRAALPALHSERALVIVDGVDAALDAARALARAVVLSEGGPALLFTARIRLGLSEEQVFELGGLPREEGAALFAAHAAHLGLEVDDRSATLRIADALEGIPLALEIAASRLSMVTAGELADRVERRALGEVAEGRVLREAIAASIDALSARERRSLAECAVFRGGFTVEAAEHVLSNASEVLDVLQTLRERSLLVVEASGTERRLRPLELVRDQVLALLDHPARERVDARHAAYYLALAERAMEDLGTARGRAALSTLMKERENLAVIWLRRRWIAPMEALRAARALDDLLTATGPTGLHFGLLEEAQVLAATVGAHREGAHLATSEAHLHVYAGQIERGVETFARAAQLADTAGDRELLRICRLRGAMIAAHRSPRDAQATLDALSDALGPDASPTVRALADIVRGFVASPREAEALLDRARSTAHAAGALRLFGSASIQRADAALRVADFRTTAAVYDEAAQAFDAVGHQRLHAASKGMAAIAHFLVEEHPRFIERAREALDELVLFQDVGHECILRTFIVLAERIADRPSAPFASCTPPPALLSVFETVELLAPRLASDPEARERARAILADAVRPTHEHLDGEMTMLAALLDRALRA